MSRHFVAVGGTGQHVALALSDLLVLAHTVVPDPLPPVSFLLLDSDPTASEADAPSAWQLCDQQLRTLAAVPDRTPGAPTGGWRSPLPVIGEGVRNAREAVDDILGVGASDLLLTPEQEEIGVTNGYHGEPRVAAILTDVLISRLREGTLKEDDPLRRLANAITQAGDRICVAGSTIGGTGSGVLPRLVEHLVSVPGAQASICTIIGLEWFELENDAANQERMAANSAASLWHYIQKQQQGKFRLVLWGHPNVTQSRRERSFGNRSQGAKTDLTLPHYAAAAATAFLWGSETTKEHVAPVSTPGSLHIPLSLEILPHADLQFLLQRNHDLIGRLELLVQYLEHPYQGSVMPMFRAGGTVPGLDRVQAVPREKLIRDARALMQAKGRAIERLRASDPQLVIGATRRRYGIRLLRQWFPVDPPPAIGQLARLLDEVVLADQHPSAERALPARAKVHADFGPNDPIGTRARLATSNVDDLASFPDVQALRIPNAHGVERMLHTVFENEAVYWPAGNLSSVLRKNSGPAAPPPLGSHGADTFVPWVQRWFIVLSALCSGAARVRPLEKSVLGITHLVVTTIGTTETVIGYLSTEFSCVPNVSDFWTHEDLVSSVATRVGALRTYTQPWVRALKLAGACKYGAGSLPQWLKLIADTLGDDVPSEVFADARATLPVQWGSNTVNVPLPGDSDVPLADAMCAAFSLEVKDLTEAADDFKPEERNAWNDMTSHKHTAALLARSDTGWARATAAHIVWVDLLEDKTRAAMNGKIFFGANRGWAWRMSGGMQLLTNEDVLTTVVAVLNPENTAKFAAYPVRAEYAPLLEACTSSRQADDSVIADVKLVGRPEFRRTYTANQVRKYERLTVFSWPKLTTRPNSSQAILFWTADPPQFRYRLLYGDATKRTTAASPVMKDDAYPQYLVPSDNSRVLATEQPLAIAVSCIDGPTDRETEIGLLPYHDAFKPLSHQPEFWSVDLGTSSTVVAKKRGELNETILVHPTEKRDATTVLSMGPGVSRTGLNWFSTWSDKKAVDTKATIMPSQIIELSAIRRRTASPDLGKRVFGQDFTLDHGEKIEDAYEAGIVDNLKWRTDERSAYRKHFLYHVLEQAVSMEYARTESMPGEFNMTFTLPLRQRDDVTRFTTEVEEVVGTIQQRLGITIKPFYLWESLAVAPSNIAGSSGMIVVADLGGGTLDMFAASYEGAQSKTQAVDSAYIGGHRCVEILHRRNVFGSRDFTTYTRAMRSGLKPDGITPIDRKTLEAENDALREYFDILYRYITLWTATLRKKWKVAQETPTTLQLAGLGWSLPGCPGRARDIAELLTDISGQLDLPFAFQADAEQFTGEARKTLLAANCLRVGGLNRDQIAASAESLEMVLGLEVTVGAKMYPADSVPRQVKIGTSAGHVAQSQASALIPQVTSAQLNELARRLSTKADPKDPRRGALSPTTLALELSPLTCLAEIAVDDLVSRQ